MVFCPIFKAVNPTLWTICYPEDKGEMIFDLFFDMVNDTQFLFDYFKRNQALLKTPFWNGITIDEAIDQVLDEAFEFELELKCFEIEGPDCAGIHIRQIFEPLDKSEYMLQSKNRGLKKARTNPAFFNKQMLRVYAIGLDDGTIVITGGAIKLTGKMEGLI